MVQSKVKEQLGRTISDLEYRINEADNGIKIMDALDQDVKIQIENMNTIKEQLKRLKSVYEGM